MTVPGAASLQLPVCVWGTPRLDHRIWWLVLGLGLSNVAFARGYCRPPAMREAVLSAAYYPFCFIFVEYSHDEARVQLCSRWDFFRGQTFLG